MLCEAIPLQRDYLYKIAAKAIHLVMQAHEETKKILVGLTGDTHEVVGQYGLYSPGKKWIERVVTTIVGKQVFACFFDY